MTVDSCHVVGALEQAEVVPFFQPLVRLNSGSLSGFEVLARWRHPDHGPILPTNFIEVTEGNGLMNALSEQVLRRALTDAMGLGLPPRLSCRRHSGREVPLQPLVHGGGQERGLRPGTQPVHLIVGFGMAAKLADRDFELREASNRRFREELLSGLSGLPLTLNGRQPRVLPHVLNFSVSGISSEAAMVALRNLVAVSNGSACSSARYEPSHVLRAMGLVADDLEGAMRFSWCHMTPSVDWNAVRNVFEGFLS